MTGRKAPSALVDITPRKRPYSDWQLANDSVVGGLSLADRHRFAAKVREDESGCWLWTASAFPTGYGQFRMPSHDSGSKQKTVYAHRVSWALSHGPIPEGMSVLHHCDVPRCVNPSHLFVGTHTDNMRDASRKGRLSVPRPSRQKVTDAQADEMVALVRDGAKQVDVARQFGVSEVFVSLVVRGLRRQLRPAKKQKAA